jgi:hypothetical protein
MPTEKGWILVAIYQRWDNACALWDGLLISAPFGCQDSRHGAPELKFSQVRLLLCSIGMLKAVTQPLWRNVDTAAQ